MAVNDGKNRSSIFRRCIVERIKNEKVIHRRYVLARANTADGLSQRQANRMTHAVPAVLRGPAQPAASQTLTNRSNTRE